MKTTTEQKILKEIKRMIEIGGGGGGRREENGRGALEEEGRQWD